jgi:hypothetical protein
MLPKNRPTPSTYAQWSDETEKLNAGIVLATGQRFVTHSGNKGTVVEIDAPAAPTDEDHGTVTVLQNNGTAEDYTEHYVFHGWQRLLRVERL